MRGAMIIIAVLASPAVHAGAAPADDACALLTKQDAVTALGDESTTDYWSARRRAAAGANPSLGGPEYTGWRRQWALSVRRRQGIAGWRKPPTRRWPAL